MGLRPGRAKGPWVGDNIATGVVTAGANVGAGTGLVFRDITGNTINLRTISAGTAISVVTAGDVITVTNTAPESTTVSNVGTGTGNVYRDMTIAQINLKTIKQGTGITVTNNADDVTITCTVTGESTTVTNVGTGTGNVYRDMTLAQINLKTIKQGTGITVTNNADDVTITCTVTGESTTVTNVGTGTGNVYRDMTIAQINLKTIKQGTGITVTNNADDVTIACTVTGESTTVANVGTGTGNVYRDMTGAQINLKTIKQGTLMTVTNNADDVTIATTAQNNTASNLGTGTGVYSTKSGSDLRFNSIKAGTGITVTLVTNDITIANSGILAVANVGSGTGLVWRDTITGTANLKRIAAGSNISITNGADDITIATTGVPTGSGTSPYITYWSGATTLGSGPVQVLNVISSADIFFPDGVFAVFGNTATPASYEGAINGSFSGSTFSLWGRRTTEISGNAGTSMIRLYSGIIDINSTSANVDTYVRGLVGIITSHDAGDDSFQMRERVTIQGLIDNVGSPIAGGSRAAPTVIDIGATAGSVIRISPASAANSYYRLTNPKNWQIVTVHIEASTYPARICVGSGATPNMYAVIPPAQAGALLNSNMAFLQWNPNALNGSGSWVQCMVRPQPVTQALTDGANIAVDADDKDCAYTVTLGGNRQLDTPTGSFFNGQKLLFAIRQDGTGTRILTYGAGYRFSTDLPSPTLSTGINKLDYLAFVYNAADSKWDFVGKVFGFN